MKTVVLHYNADRDPGLAVTAKAAELLLSAGFCVTARMATPDPRMIDPRIVPKTAEALYQNADAMLVIGGDGTILRAASVAALHGIPILAVNTGRLGYIAQLERQELDQIVPLLQTESPIQKRALLSVSLYRNATPVFEDRLVVNDAVITKNTGHGVIETSLYCDSDLICGYRGDGMIVSTATGSTAYAMSAGGVVLDPSLSVMEAIPICAHSLKARPIVFAKDHVITMTSHSPNACLTLDGDETTLLTQEDRTVIRISPTPLSLIATPGSFGRILYRKMSDL